jgi:hypothetical protein
MREDMQAGISRSAQAVRRLIVWGIMGSVVYTVVHFVVKFW